MKPIPLETELLRLLAEMPFLDRRELVCVSGESRSAVYQAVERLKREGLVAAIPHAAELTPPTRRYCLTAEGVHRLAEIDCITLNELLSTRPVSHQWRRVLLERLDALAVIYRLVSDVAGITRSVSLRLFRSGPLDAALMLPGSRTIGVVRQGPTADPTAFAKRVWRLAQGTLPGAVLVLASDEVRLRHARRLLARSPVNALLAMERDAGLAGPAYPSGVRPRATPSWTWATCWPGSGPADTFPRRDCRRRQTLPGELRALGACRAPWLPG